MKKLELNQMENLQGGLTQACKKAILNLGLNSIGFALSLAGGPFGIGIGGSALLLSLADMNECHGQF